MLMTNSRPASVILPANPSPGDVVGFLDVAGTFPFNGLTINPGPLAIYGVIGPFSYAVPNFSSVLIYSGSIYGWRTFSTFTAFNGFPDSPSPGSLLYYDFSSSDWLASDTSCFSYNADSNSLNVHNIETRPFYHNLGPYNCSNYFDEDNEIYFVHFDPQYGDITSSFPAGCVITLHGGSSEGDTYYINSSSYVTYDAENGYTVIEIGEDVEHDDYISATSFYVTDKMLYDKSDTKFSGNVSSKNFVITDDFIKIGSINNISSFDYKSTFIGRVFSFSDFYSSVSLGYMSDKINVRNSVAVGYNACSWYDSFNNVWVGNQAGHSADVSKSVLLGCSSGFKLKSKSGGTSNNIVAVGYYSLNNASSDNTVSLGYYSGYNSSTRYSVFIGDKAGYQESNDYRFILKQNTINTVPLLYGDFHNGRLSVNMNNASTYNLDVGGSGHFSTSLTVDSSLFISGHIWQTNTGFSVFLGEQAGNADDLTDNKNTFVGYQSGKTNTSGNYNVALGYQSLLYNSTGGFNTAVGSQSLAENTIGMNNTGIGEFSLNANTEGNDNTALGRNSLQANFTGNYNVAVGKGASFSNAAGSNNTALGYQAGYNAINSDSNVFIGYQAGFNETGSGKLYISNTSTNTPLIYGVFENNFLKINGTLEVSGQLQLSNMNTAPASASAPGKVGEIRFTADYIYICVATDTWKRVAISTW